MNTTLKKLTLGASILPAMMLSAQDHPNIVMFIVDDMGLMDTSLEFDVDSCGKAIRHSLNEWYHTPNMQRLASQGVRFSTFYAQSVSSPSRCSLMTGLNAARHRTTNWINAESNNRCQYGPSDWNWNGLTKDDQIYPQILSQAGYRSIHVGKAHFSNQYAEGVDPKNLGFDVNIAGSAIGHPGSYHGENGYGWIKGQLERAVPDLDKYHGTSTFLSDALTLEAKSEIKKAVDDNIPFYLNLSHYAVHQPFETDERFIDNYPEGEKSNQARAFATLIEGQDKSLGDILEYLDSLKIAENTLIIFLGDNGSDAPLGDKFGYSSSAPFRGKKGTEFEGGMRVPFIISWAKYDDSNKFQQRYPIKKGGIQTQMADIMDVYPTILSVANVSVPEGKVLDGSDLKTMVTCQTDPMHKDFFLMHFPHENYGYYHTTYRKGDWKVIYYYHPENPTMPEYKLYNLSSDPYEHHDLSQIEKNKLTQMVSMMVDELNKEEALYPVDAKGNVLYPVIP